jgi:hypothetical protein
MPETVLDRDPQLRLLRAPVPDDVIERVVGRRADECGCDAQRAREDLPTLDLNNADTHCSIDALMRDVEVFEFKTPYTNL